ncbi:MAG: RNA polymerase sigma factor [Vicinamibacterales bacterium]
MSHQENLDDFAPGRVADELLVVRCQLGEPDAFDALIARWHRPLWLYVRRMTGRDDEAQDLLQEVWLRVVRGIAKLRDGSRFRGWLFGIARRALMDRLRHEYAALPTNDVDVGDVAAEAEPSDCETDLASLEAALEMLPTVERDVLTLFYLRDLTLAELAQALGVPVGTVKSRLFRARKMLRASMQERRDS